MLNLEVRLYFIQGFRDSLMLFDDHFDRVEAVLGPPSVMVV